MVGDGGGGGGDLPSLPLSAVTAGGKGLAGSGGNGKDGKAQGAMRLEADRVEDVVDFGFSEGMGRIAVRSACEKRRVTQEPATGEEARGLADRLVMG